MADPAGQHPDVGGPPDLRRCRRQVKGPYIDLGAPVPTGVGRSHRQVLVPPVEQAAHEPDAGPSGRHHWDGRQVPLPVQYPPGEE